MSTHGYAQTNLQLFDRALAKGYSATDLSLLVNAYDHSMRMFSGVHRGNGKPFVNHLVGTASILMEHGLSPTIVIAGLAHASYSHGSLFARVSPWSARARRKLKIKLGDAVEELVWTYNGLNFGPDNLRQLQTELAGSTILKNSIVIRLANDLEDLLDHGLEYCGKRKSVYQSKDSRDLVLSIATAVGYPQLAQEIFSLSTKSTIVPIPAEMVRLHADSYCLPPRASQLLRTASRSIRARLHD